jgi:hypothetical protein
MENMDKKYKQIKQAKNPFFVRFRPPRVLGKIWISIDFDALIITRTAN